MDWHYIGRVCEFYSGIGDVMWCHFVRTYCVHINPATMNWTSPSIGQPNKGLLSERIRPGDDIVNLRTVARVVGQTFTQQPWWLAGDQNHLGDKWSDLSLTCTCQTGANIHKGNAWLGNSHNRDCFQSVIRTAIIQKLQCLETSIVYTNSQLLITWPCKGNIRLTQLANFHLVA